MSDLAARLEAKSIPVTECGCRIWLGWIDRDGYGALSVNNRFTRAHRAAWEVANGPVPSGLIIMHKCDVRCCIEPTHLKPGTNRDNVDDMLTKGRQIRGELHYVRRTPGLKRGENNGRAILRKRDIAAICQRQPEDSTASIAREYGVSWSAIDRIRKGISWGTQ